MPAPELNELQTRQIERVQLVGVVVLAIIAISATVVVNLGLISSWVVAPLALVAMAGVGLIGSWRAARIEGCSVPSVMSRSLAQTRTDLAKSARRWARRANPRRWNEP